MNIDPHQSTTTHRARKRRSRVWLAALVAIPVLGVAAVAVGGWLWLHRGISVHGLLRLTSTTTGMTRSGDTCEGANALADIQAGAQVTVTDQTGAVVALGTLDVGHAETDSVCVFPFEVTVPSGHGFYGIEVGHRGAVRMSEADLSAGPQLAVTDNN